MNKYTSGPWEVRESPSSGIKFVYQVGDKRPISGVSPTERGRDIEECAANANLISAAPELLEALEAFNAIDDFSGWHEAYWPAIAKARAAIDKAKGGAA